MQHLCAFSSYRVTPASKQEL